VSLDRSVKGRLPARGEPRLAGRFLAVTVVGLLLAGGGISLVVERTLAQQAEHDGVARAHVAASQVLDHQLRSSDLARSLSPARRRRLTRMLGRSGLGLGRAALGASLYSGRNLVVSTSPNTLPRVANERLDRAAAGNSLSFVSTSPAGRVLRTLLPVRLGGSGSGVLEIDQDYGTIDASARHTAWLVGGVMEGLLLGLCVLLLPMLTRAGRRLRSQLARLDEMASHDELTGLFNRAGFRRLLDETLTVDPKGALLLADLEGFHDINETIGDECGDGVLRELAQRLASLDAATGVARLGEDEFALLLPAVGRDEIPELLHALQNALAAPVRTNGIQLALAVTTGVAFYPGDGDDAESLLRHAGTALSQAKADHVPTHSYRPEQERRDIARLSFVAELRAALQAGQLVVHYQPQLDLRTERLCGVEALVRWQHPTRGLIPASRFIDAAERAGLTGDIGRHVLASATRQWRDWHDHGRTVEMAVNLSTIDLLDLSLPGTITSLLVEHGMPAELLIVEITERTLLQGEHQSCRMFRHLHNIGVRLSIDDFGTGYSSLAVLRQLPIQQVKIDKSFVDGIPNDRQNDQIVQSTIQLVHSLGATTVAEGVETAEQLDHLASLGCDVAQGYLIGRPLSAEQLTKHLMHPVPAPKTSSPAEAALLPATA
jgi:diguanylate cyclase (GGDEF)-like protein